MGNHLELIWLGLTLVLGGIEAITVGLTTIWFAAGSLCAFLAALLGWPLGVQAALFIVVSVLCLLTVRPLAQKHLNNKVQATNADRILGMEARVTEEIDNLQGTGAVAVDHKIWTARSQGEEPIPEGSRVRILRIEGVKVLVELCKEESICRS